MSKNLIKKAGNRALSFLLLFTIILQSVVIPRNVKADGKVEMEINGYQINSNLEAFRTIYTLYDDADRVEEVGLIYGLKDRADESEMVAGSKSKYVYSYAATEKGVSVINYGNSENSTSYIMTMKFIRKAAYYASKMYIRPYARLSDGTYTYGSIDAVSVFDIANEIYQKSLMNNEAGHNYLYDNILSLVDENYEKKEYSPKEETSTGERQTEPQTEQQSTIDPALEPEEVFGHIILETQGNTVKFVWGADEFINKYGQLFNVYIDGELKIEKVIASVQEYTFDTPGTHTIRITGLLNGKETAGQTLTVQIGDTPVEETTTREAETKEPETKEPETTTHRMVEPGVQSEAADSGVASNVSLMDCFDGIDTVLSSTKGNTASNEGIDKLFDRNTSTKFFTGDAPAITIAWKMKRAVILKNYTFVLAGDASTYTYRDPHSWAVYGSLDGENWTTISDVENGGITHVNRGEYTFNCTVETPCQYFMLIIKNSGDDGRLYYGSQMSEIYLNGDVCRITEGIGKDITNQVKEIKSRDTTVAGFNANEGVDNLFDSNNSTKLFSTSSTPCSIVWTMNYNSTLYSYTLTTGNDNASYRNRTVKSWELYGSSDGNGWTLIDTVRDSGMKDVNYADYTYLVDRVGEYKYYKLTITEKYGTGFQLSGITLRGNSVIESEYKALFVGDWDKVTAPGYQQALYDAFYDVYPRQYTRWGTGTEPKKIFVTADKGYDGVAYTSGSSIVISVDWMNNNPTGIGYFTHELTHAAQQYGNVSSSGPAWWVENMANYGGFRYYHWTTPQTAQVYYANDKSLQDWNYEAYGNNKWFFAYMDSRYPTTKDSNGNVTYGLIDALNHLLKDNKGTTYDDNPYDTSTPWNQTVKRITGYDCIESLRLHYVNELENGTWTFTGFKNYADNYITENIPGVPNIDYPEYVGKKHGNVTNAKLSSAVTSGTNLMSGATIIGTSGYVNASETAQMFIDGNLSTKWCATSGSVENAEFALEGAQHFVKIDLGSTKTFNTYTLYNTTSREGFGNTTEWEVLISNDGKNWTSVDYQVGKNDSVSSYGIGTQSARYITFKVFNADNGGVGTARLYELQLYNR